MHYSLIKLALNWVILAVIAINITGCTATSTGSSAMTKNELIEKAQAIADFDSSKDNKAIREYFTKKPHSKAFSLDPYSKTWRSTWNYDFLRRAKESALKDSRFVLLAANNNIVWEENLKEYNSSPIGLGRKYYKAKQYGKALIEFLQFEHTHANDWYVHNRLGWTYFKLEQYNKAELSFQKSIFLKQNSFYSYAGLIKSLYWQGKYSQANIAAEKTLKITKKTNSINDVHFWQAMIALAQNDFHGAARLMRKKAVLGFEENNSPKGLMCQKVFKNTPAEMCGLLPGDIVTDIDNISIKGRNAKFIRGLLSTLEFGTSVPIKIKRGHEVYAGRIHVGISASMKQDYNIIDKLTTIHGNESQKSISNLAKNKSQQPVEKILSLAATEPASLPGKKYFTATHNKWAIIIGISEYSYSGENGLSNLLYADDDAKSFARSLKNLGWSNSHIKLLINEDATRRNIMIALGSWLTKAGANDQIILFWAGHGYFDPADQEKVYFATYDTDISLPVTGYRMDEVREQLEEIGAKNIVLFADTCHAGKLITRGNRGISIVSNLKKMVNDKDFPKGWIFMVSADTDRLAIEHTSWSNGAFTHSLIKGLNGEADGYQSAGQVDGIVTMAELKSFLLSAMPEETQKILGVAKHPVITTSSGDPDIWDMTLQVGKGD